LTAERAEHAEKTLYCPEFKAKEDRILLLLAFPASLASVAPAVFAIFAVKQFG
jgi:hypothetical protein